MKFHVLLIVVALLGITSAKRDKKHRKANGCKYDKGEWSACDETTNEMKRTLTLKEAKDGCDATIEQTRPCKQKKHKMKCKYNKGDWGPCDSTTNLVSRTLTLRKGDGGCKQTHTQTFSCDKYEKIKKIKEEKKAAKESLKAEKMAFKELHKKLKGLRKAGCNFKENVSACNHDTHKVTKTFTLESGDATTCVLEPVEISCRMQEKIEKIQQRKKQKKMERKMKKKENKRKMKQEMKKKNKKERRRNRKSRQDKCKYETGPWSDCDVTTDTMKMTMTLKSVDSNNCPATKILSKKCKKPCKYITGKWGPCKNGISERIDRLRKNSQDICEPRRTLTKKCRGRKKIKKNKGGCIYDKGTWEDCDPTTNKRAKKKLLTSGDRNKCSAEKLVYRSCVRANGQARCFFGTWGDWSACQNGVQKKHREVVQGGVDCQKRAVKTRPCS